MNTGKNVQLLVDVLSGVTGAQPHVTYQLGPDVGATIQTDLGGGGAMNIDIQGRMGPDAPWANLPGLGGITTAAMVAMSRLTPEVRVNINSNTATRLRVWIMG